MTFFFTEDKLRQWNQLWNTTFFSHLWQLLNQCPLNSLSQVVCTSQKDIWGSRQIRIGKVFLQRRNIQTLKWLWVISRLEAASHSLLNNYYISKENRLLSTFVTSKWTEPFLIFSKLEHVYSTTWIWKKKIKQLHLKAEI